MSNKKGNEWLVYLVNVHSWIFVGWNKLKSAFRFLSLIILYPLWLKQLYDYGQ